MNLTFLNPWFLIGLSAGILPILIHRLTKRKAIVRKFSAVRLLLQSQRQMARPQRLKHLLLLILRILAVVSLVFLMARPVLTREGLLTWEGGAKVVILDNSMSMSYQDPGGIRYDLAKRAAKQMFENLKAQVMIIPTALIGDRSVSEKDLRWMRPEEAIRELPAVPLSFGRGDPATALTLAYQKLRDLKVSKEIVVISDMAKGDWEGFNLSKLGVVSAETGVSFLRIGGPDRDPNLAVKGARLAEGDGVTGTPGRMEVTLSNLSEQPATAVVQLFLSGVKADQKSVEVKAREDGDVSFELFLDRAGWVDGEVRLPGDRLPLDDLLYFSLKAREKVRVLVVDGDPRTSLKAGESYYLVSALNPGASGESPFLTRVITEEEMAGIDMKRYETVFLVNVSRPQGSKVAAFVESGKPVFIFLGDRVVSEDYNGLPFLPWRVRENGETDASTAVKIARVDESHEALKFFSGPEGKGLRSASFRRYFKMEGNGRNLLTLENGDPLLAETDFGKGRLFLFASSADPDWNDLPLKAGYLPLVQGLLKDALGLNKDTFPAIIRWGQSPGERVPPVQVAGPPGGPGIYRFVLPSGEVRHGVNVPLEESDLSKMGQEEIRKKFGRPDAKVVDYREGGRGAIHGTRKELWPFLLGFLLLVLTAEMGIANKR